ncbi:MAG TPA: thymidine phosphorylase family protein [Gemmatimonadales bacterium]|nr:thymidine phosphorylase family protein [Gemmatimonadales bacterium]
MSATHRARRLGIDTGQEAVVYLHRDSPIVRSEGFNSQARVEVRAGERTMLATVGVVGGGILVPEEAGLSEAAWLRLGVTADDRLTFAHPAPVESLGLVRGKIYGQPLTADDFQAIVHDVAAGRYSDIELAAFLAGCAGGRLTDREVVDLTLAMLAAGDRLSWPRTPVMDKHSVGGLPGNRTSIIVVPIVAAAGLLIPKTSSRAITSPAGTADTMEMLAPVDLDVARMRRVVEQEGGCLVWGGRARLSPADDVLIRVERPLDLDSPAQLVASVLSKKAAAGATHVVMDVPVGPTAKIRSAEEAEQLAQLLRDVGQAIGLTVRPVLTQGTQPIGRGIGPALEARDALAVLQRAPSAPADLRERALLLAGHLLELGGAAPAGTGDALAGAILDDGRAERKFEAICEAQGGRRTPPTAVFTRVVPARKDGRVTVIDNRRLARVAKLAGAPHEPAAGLELAVRLGDTIRRGDPLYTVHASALGELEYGLAYATSTPDIVTVAELP